MEKFIMNRLFKSCKMLISLFALCSNYVLVSMEKPILEKVETTCYEENKAPESYLFQLPNELLLLIFEYGAIGKTTNEALNNLKSIELTNKKIRGLVNTNYFISRIINNRPKPESKILMALSLNNAHAMEWLKKFIQEPHHKKAILWQLKYGLLTVNDAVFLNGWKVVAQVYSPQFCKNKLSEHLFELFNTFKNSTKQYDWYAQCKNLLAAGADPNMMGNDHYQKPLLILATDVNDTRYLDLLLAAGGNPNLKDPQTSYTLLMNAIYNENVPAAQLLLVHGADAQIITNDGQTAMSIAHDLPYPSDDIFIKLLRNNETVKKIE